MKRFKQILLTLMVLAIGASAASYTSAENTNESGGQYGLNLLLDPKEIPATTAIRYNVEVPEGAVVEDRTASVELVSSRGDVLNVDVAFALVNLPLSDDQWKSVTDWVKGVVTASVQSVGADSESLANVVAAAVNQQRSANAQSMEVWANANLKVRSVTASVPYYPELSVVAGSVATQRLQQRLIELGFLSDRADGYYGANTEQAVKELEQYVRWIEQDVIDAMPEATPTPVPTPTPTPAANVIPMVFEMPVVTAVPMQTQAPRPATAVDGVADPMLQAYLFSDNFKVMRGSIGSGSSGDGVLRLQRRLYGLGFMATAPDGAMGSETARSLGLFQYYNGLPVTGQADAATTAKLFSADVRKPDNAMLTTGSSGEAVSKLQKRLRILGFGAINVDGSFGQSTKTGVENLQQYMQSLESGALAASADGQSPVIIPTTVNGIADPLLLDEFYSSSFPAIPAAMGNGASGRDVVRLQRRLNLLEYYYGTLDGDYGSGTAKAVSDFQKRHGLPQTGNADATTLQTLFNENAKKALKPYVLKVSVDDQRVYVYGLDANNEYNDLVKTMKCSTGRKGTPTPTGTFTSTTGPGARWHYFTKFSCWAQYAYYIQGDIMFHSVLYGSKGGSVTRSSVNNLGRRASHGCVRLSVEDAKWIWTNCPRNTTVVVY